MNSNFARIFALICHKARSLRSLTSSHSMTLLKTSSTSKSCFPSQFHPESFCSEGLFLWRASRLVSLLWFRLSSSSALLFAWFSASFFFLSSFD